MSADVEIESLLSGLGLGREELSEGREVLEAEGLTRPGKVRISLEKADRVLLWGATELHHKVSKQYADVSATKQKIVHIPRRGISQLLAAAVESVRRRAG